MLITGFNPEIPEQEVTYFSLAVLAGATSITVQNNNEFQQNDRILLGKEGTETAETVSVAGVVTAGTALTITPCLFPHNPDEPITRLRYDQVKFYRSTTTSTGTYTLLVGTPIPIDWDGEDSVTTFDDAQGLSTYFYKISYYNSATSLESALSDPIGGGGYARKTVGFLYDEFTREVNDIQNILIDPIEYLGWLNQVNDEIELNSRKPYVFLHTRTVYTLSAQVEAFPLPSNSDGSDLILKIDEILYLYTNPVGSAPVISPDTDPQPPTGDVDLYPMFYLPFNQFRLRFQDQNFITDDNLQYYTFDSATNNILFSPLPTNQQVGAAYLYYWKHFTQLTSFGQVFETPNFQVYKQFCLYRYFLKKAENDQTYASLWQEYKTNYGREIIKLTKYNQRTVGQPRGFEFGTDTSANTYDRVVQARRGFRTGKSASGHNPTVI
jgi:hypothetical protein